MNGKFGATILVFLCFMSILAPNSCARTHASAANKPNGWILHQVSDEYGSLRTEVTHDAMRLQTEDMTVIVKGPNYDLCLANSDTHKYLVTHIRDFAYRYRKGGPGDTAIVSPGSDGEICQLKAKERVGKCVGKNNEVRFWTTNEFNTTKELNDVCIDYFCLTEMPPGYGGFLLRSINYSARGTHYIYLDTKGAERAYIPPSRFDYPTKFEKVDDFVGLQEKGLAKKKVTTEDADTKLLFQNPDDLPPGVDKIVKPNTKQTPKKHP